MPVLDILDTDGSLSVFAPFTVQATVLFPDDEVKRQRYLTILASQFWLTMPPEEAQRSPVPRAWIETLIESPSWDHILAEGNRYSGRSWVAGEVVRLMLTAALHHAEVGMTLTQAIWLLVQTFRGTPAWNGQPLPLVERSAWQAWGRFKSVSHFIAVERIWMQNSDAPPSDPRWLNHVLGNFAGHLAEAEAIRSASVARRILKPSETWRVPDGLKLPPAGFGVPPLSAAALAKLSQYRPEHSSEGGPD